MIEALEQILKTSKMEVHFTKKKGGIRVMKCTQDLKLIPAEHHSGKDDHRIIGPKIIGVYDFDVSAWRSFRKDSVKKFEVC